MKGDREFARFLGYSIASSDEVENHLITARDRRLITDARFLRLLEQLAEVRRMLHGLRKKVQPRTPLTPPRSARSRQSRTPPERNS